MKVKIEKVVNKENKWINRCKSGMILHYYSIRHPKFTVCVFAIKGKTYYYGKILMSFTININKINDIIKDKR